MVIDPDTGKLLKSIDFGHLADRITSLAFGGPELMDIYVTSGKFLLKTFLSNQIFFLKTKAFFKTGSTTTEDGKVKGGQLYVIKNTGARGLPGRGFNTKVKNPF